MSDSILVRVTLDSYDMASTGRQTQVYVQIPEVARVSWLLPEDRFHGLVDRAWPEVLDVTHDFVTYGDVASNSSSTAAWKAVMEWLREDANRDELQAAWEQDQARRHPVARKLLKENEQLRARVAELEKANAGDELQARIAGLEEQLTDQQRAVKYYADQARRRKDRITALEGAPLAFADQLDAKSLDNFLIALASATEHEPMGGAVARIHELIASYREPEPGVDGITRRMAPLQAMDGAE